MKNLAKSLQGILSVLQTPFNTTNEIDFESYTRLIQYAIASKVNGFLVPVVASEVAYLAARERIALVQHVHKITQNRIPLVIGASVDTPANCRPFVELAENVVATAYLVAVPQQFYHAPKQILPFFQSISKMSSLPLIIQDFQLNGPGLSLEQIVQLRDALPNFVGIKIETQPAGPKYTAVRKVCGDDFFIAGGWAVTQMIEALDRGVDAMIPESSMLPVYCTILQAYQQGDRERAQRLFRRLLPVLSFTNQEVGTSIAFFKRLLVRKGIFQQAAMRWPEFSWDKFNNKIAEELIEDYLQLETEILHQTRRKK